MTRTTSDDLAGLDPDDTALEQWDRWPGEPPAAYEFFTTYRLMGRARTLRKVAAEAQRSEQYLMRLSADWQWVRRAQAWDAEQVRLHEARMRDRRLEIAEQHLSVANLVMAKAVEALRALDPSRLNPRDLLSYVEAAVKVQRTVVGEVTERVEHQLVGGDDLDVDALSDEQLMEHLSGLRLEIDRRVTTAGT